MIKYVFLCKESLINEEKDNWQTLLICYFFRGSYIIYERKRLSLENLLTVDVLTRFIFCFDFFFFLCIKYYHYRKNEYFVFILLTLREENKKKKWKTDGCLVGYLSSSYDRLCLIENYVNWNRKIVKKKWKNQLMMLII